MLEKIYLHLLLICSIFHHEIIATDEDTRESSDFLVRKKRVISHVPGELTPIPIGHVNYIVNIGMNGRSHCAGVILSHYTVITAASCVAYSLLNYHVLCGSGDIRGCKYHSVKSKLTHFGSLPHETNDGIALITVDPPFEYGLRIGNIQIHVGPLPVGTQVTVAGWGCVYPINPIPSIQRRLRKITLPIMNHQQCQAVYRGQFNISEKHICTYDAQKHCARTDTGAPLVLEDKLVGIHIWKGEFQGQRNPDVFINLQRADYSEWITEHLNLQIHINS